MAAPDLQPPPSGPRNSRAPGSSGRQTALPQHLWRGFAAGPSADSSGHFPGESAATDRDPSPAAAFAEHHTTHLQLPASLSVPGPARAQPQLPPLAIMPGGGMTGGTAAGCESAREGQALRSQQLGSDRSGSGGSGKEPAEPRGKGGSAQPRKPEQRWAGDAADLASSGGRWRPRLGFGAMPLAALGLPDAPMATAAAPGPLQPLEPILMALQRHLTEDAPPTDAAAPAGAAAVPPAEEPAGGSALPSAASSKSSQPAIGQPPKADAAPQQQPKPEPGNVPKPDQPVPAPTKEKRPTGVVLAAPQGSAAPSQPQQPSASQAAPPKPEAANAQKQEPEAKAPAPAALPQPPPPPQSPPPQTAKKVEPAPTKKPDALPPPPLKSQPQRSPAAAGPPQPVKPGQPGRPPQPLAAAPKPEPLPPPPPAAAAAANIARQLRAGLRAAQGDAPTKLAASVRGLGASLEPPPSAAPAAATAPSAAGAAKPAGGGKAAPAASQPPPPPPPPSRLAGLKADPPVPRELMGKHPLVAIDGKQPERKSKPAPTKPISVYSERPRPTAKPAALTSSGQQSSAAEDEDEDEAAEKKPPAKTAGATATLRMIVDTLGTGYARLGTTIVRFDYGGAAAGAAAAVFTTIREADYAEMGRATGAAFATAVRRTGDAVDAAVAYLRSLEPDSVRDGIAEAFATARRQIADGWTFVRTEVLALERNIEDFDPEAAFQGAERWAESELDPAQNEALAKAQADISEVLKSALVTKPYEEIISPLLAAARGAAESLTTQFASGDSSTSDRQPGEEQRQPATKAPQQQLQQQPAAAPATQTASPAAQEQAATQPQQAQGQSMAADKGRGREAGKAAAEQGVGGQGQAPKAVPAS